MMPMEDVDHEEDDEEEQEEEREDDNGDRDAPSPFVRLRERRDREPHRLRTMARRLRILGRPVERKKSRTRSLGILAAF